MTRQQFSRATKSYTKAITDNPIRKAIIQSILSREDASTLEEIEQDVSSSGDVWYHLRILKREGILASDRDPRDNRRATYYISSDSDELQDVLRSLFPEAMTIEA